MIERVLLFCRPIAGYDGPGLDKAANVVLGRYPESERAALVAAFEFGYKRGYADAAAYVAEWIEEEEDS